MKTLVLLLVSASMIFSEPTSSQADPLDDSLKTRRVGFRTPGTVFDADWDRSSDRWQVAPATKRSLLEPAAFVITYHAIGMGLLTSMDPVETGFKPAHIRNWADGMMSPPIWDNDSHITNYVLHPLWGSETYLRARNAHYSPFESFLFSTAASVLWEYGFESWAEHPSQQDLLFTSTLGSVLGEVRYRAHVALLKQDGVWATVLLVFLDPLGTLFSQTTRLAGNASRGITSAVTSGVSFAPGLTSAATLAPSITEGTGDGSGPAMGLQLSVRL